MVVYLSLLVCALNSSTCHVTVPHERPAVGLSGCQIAGMQAAAEFVKEHPGWFVSKIRCSPGSPPRAEDEA
ncbi:MAG: hypothetical protein ABI369_02245 [Acetobacteraceae bacterium]